MSTNSKTAKNCQVYWSTCTSTNSDPHPLYVPSYDCRYEMWVLLASHSDTDSSLRFRFGHRQKLNCGCPFTLNTQNLTIASVQPSTAVKCLFWGIGCTLDDLTIAGIQIWFREKNLDLRLSGSTMKQQCWKRHDVIPFGANQNKVWYCHPFFSLHRLLFYWIQINSWLSRHYFHLRASISSSVKSTYRSWILFLLLLVSE